MSELIWRGSELQKIPALLVSRVSGFGESPEYRKLRDYEFDIPGVVCAAFADYLGRIHQEERSERNARIISSAHETLEMLASLPETAVRDLVTDEIYENMECKPDALERFKDQLRPSARVLYLRWIGDTPSK